MDSYTGVRTMSASPVLIEQTADGVATVTLNRPEMHNALDDILIRDLTRCFDMLSSDRSCRMVMIKANGASFCAGADVNSMQRAARATEADNLAQAQNLALMMKTLYDFPKPLIGLVQGAAVGGGVGILACCDVVVASDASTFRLSEVKLGFVPAVIVPYVVRAIGQRAAQRYFLTAEPFSGTEAKALGLIHELVPDRMMAAAAAKLVERISAGGPKAQIAAKDLLRRLDGLRIDSEVVNYTTHLTAHLCASPEGKEGLAAFTEKRNPSWLKR